jgi:lactate dehydrogenase-like 2-hydroxyacid dehydrogenase
VGYDHYDAQALAKKGVVLTNSPGISADAVADIALHLALSTYRFTTVMEYTLREQKHTVKARQSVAALDISTGQPMSEGYPAKFAYGHEVGAKRATSPKGQNVGIAGFGAIGRATGKRLAALGMNVHYFKRRKLSAEEERELGYPATFHATVESLFKSSNLLMLTIPLTQETRHMVNQDSISLLPDGAKIVNVGRGALIDEDALVMALKSGKLSSVGLDVFEKEPAVHPELLSRLDVTLIPHLGGAEAAAAHDAYVHCMKAITNVLLEDGNGLTPVN